MQQKTTQRSHPRAARNLAALAMLAGLVLIGGSTLVSPAAEAQEPMRIGIIGTGNIGSALARHWAAAGHELVISSRNPDQLVELAQSLGPSVRVGTPREAAAFGDVVLVSVPYAAMPQIGRDYAEELAGKIVLDTSNPVERRDGEMAIEAQQKGAGVASREFLPGTRLVRAFNCIPFRALADDANREPERIAIPLGGDDAEALAVAERLVSDAGFDSVVVGSLERSRVFDLGEPLARRLFTAEELRHEVEALDLEG
jgi:8-hydroxy-5-deazaflavin:NADPH oxidoreductase